MSTRPPPAPDTPVVVHILRKAGENAMHAELTVGGTRIQGEIQRPAAFSRDWLKLTGVQSIFFNENGTPKFGEAPFAYKQLPAMAQELILARLP